MAGADPLSIDVARLSNQVGVPKPFLRAIVGGDSHFEHSPSLYYIRSNWAQLVRRAVLEVLEKAIDR